MTDDYMRWRANPFAAERTESDGGIQVSGFKEIFHGELMSDNRELFGLSHFAQGD